MELEVAEGFVVGEVELLGELFVIDDEVGCQAAEGPADGKVCVNSIVEFE